MAKISSQKFDFIFLGAGCASLSIIMRMIKSGSFVGKKMLLIDKEVKNKNDRTWCYWEKHNGFFDDIVFKEWNALNFYSPQFSSRLNIAPYMYKMIRGIDFYNYCFNEISKHNNIEICYDELQNISIINDKLKIKLTNNNVDAEDAVVFNSIYRPVEQKKDNAINLIQHFKGWLIETEEPSFDESTATLMDFRVQQQKGTTFAYTLPFTTTSALIEYTLFTENLLTRDEYDEGLQEYVHDLLKIEKYKISAVETGAIPMTNEPFQFYKQGMYFIGTAGGQTKASSGYTFQFIQKQSTAIVDYLVQGKSLLKLPVTAGRFHFYDTVLLRLLKENKLGGDKIFSQLFKRNKPASIFQFLDNETSIRQELKLISSLPILPFMKAAIKG